LPTTDEAPLERLVENEEPAMADKTPSTTPELCRTEVRPEYVPDHAVGRHIDLFDTLHRSAHAGLPYLSSITSAPAPDLYIKDSVFKPAQFNRRTDLETWWKRFELYISSTKVSFPNLRNTLLVFLDDDCMAMFDYCTPIAPMGMTDLFKHMKKIFGKTEPANIDAKGIFYTRVQMPGEDVRAFFTDLWKLAKGAFKTDATVFNVDGMVNERFINGLNDPYLIMQLTSNKVLGTSFEALEATVELVNKLESWKTNSQVAMSPVAQGKQVSFHDEHMGRAREAPASETLRVCHICKKPGHIAAYCRENRNIPAPMSTPRTITNAVINNVMMNDSIIGKCFVNGSMRVRQSTEGVY